MPVFVLLLLAGCVSEGWGQITWDGGGAADNWGDPLNWSTNTVPTASDNVSIGNVNATITIDVAAVCLSLTTTSVDMTGNRTISISGSNSLTVTGAITLNGTTSTTGNEATVLAINAGTVSCTSLAINFDAGNAGSTNRRTQVTISTGTLTVSGNITLSGDVAGGDSGIAFSSTGTVNVSGNFMSTNTGLFTASTGTVNLNGAAQSFGNYTYNNLTISGSGTKTPDAGFTINTTLDLTAGTLAAGTNLTMGAGGTPLITRSGGSMTGTPQSGNDYNVTYTGNSKTTGTELAGTGLSTVTVNLTSGQTLTLDANRAPDGNLTITSGTFDLSTFTINRSVAGGTMTLSNGTTLRIGGTNPLPTNYNTHSVGATSTVEFGGTSQTVGALNSSQNYGNLTPFRFWD